MKKHIPNLLTAGNLLAGCVGIIFSFKHPDIPAAYFIWFACIFDFLDGFVARILKVTSTIGKELDSLADVVSFGVLPAVIIYQQINQTHPDLAWFGMVLAVAAAFRLARFNTDVRQIENFIGLPTPAMALFISALPFVIEQFVLQNFSLEIYLTGTIIMAYTMVSSINLPALKFKSLIWKENGLKFIIIAVSIVAISVFGTAGISISILLYILTSFFQPKIN
jgi:CDP-diacylglycerol--serine O-phosphatidyltransferase